LTCEKALEGYDVVFASRNNLPSGNFEKYFSKFYSVLMKKFVNVLYPKNGFDTVIFNYKIRDALNQNIESNSSIQLQILNLGFKRAFIEYTKQIRKSGKSKWTISKKVKLFIDSFVAFSYAPIRFVTIIGITLFVIGITFSIYLFGRKILYNDLVSGWPMLISILTFGFGITNISLGIIAEYLWRTYDSSRKRPVFIIDDIIDLKNKKNGK